ncbi:glycosyltransferase [Pseudomonas fulva]|uniref:glycosyltransferase n=1 Tax=Pseudomonas fulva TaxID=47880 RepID=UPI002DB64540|nr:glycosyltransferase [Pseudomonas fulva]MEB8057674.1 glycosyltransferase [Pseudomonas fulva]
MNNADKILKLLKLRDLSAAISKQKKFRDTTSLRTYLENFAPKSKSKSVGSALSLTKACSPKVTIIIPCYNTDKYIDQCISHVLSQTLKNIEIIIVDDCSSDSTLIKLLDYAVSDSRITLITLNNQSGSPGRARNIGVSLANAPFIYFLDSDDWLDSNTLEQLVLSAENNDSDITFLSGFINHLGETSSKRYYKKPITDPNSDLNGFHESFMLWDKLWSSAFLRQHGLKVAHTSASEELLFILKAYYHSQKVSVSTGNYGYHYRRLNDTSITKNIRSSIYPSFEFDAWKLVDEWVQQENPDVNYQKIIKLRKILSFNYALSIVNEQFRERFITDIQNYLTSDWYTGIEEISQELKYTSQIDEFRKHLESVNDFRSLNNSTGRENIIYGPDWSSSNPYQRLLYSALKATYGSYATGFSPRQLTKAYLEEKLKTNGILHLHWLHPFYEPQTPGSTENFIATLKHAKRIGFKLIWTAHNLMPHEMTEQTEAQHLIIRQTVLDLADVVIAHDGRTKAALISKFCFDESKCKIAPHGLYERTLPHTPAVRNAVRAHLGLPTDKFTLLLAGRIRAYKGIERALSLFIDGKKSLLNNCCLVIAGHPDNPDIDERIKTAAEQYPSVLYLRGDISDEDLEALFIASDICLLPYEKSATSGLAFLSISYNKPIIASKLPAFKTFVDDGMAIWASTNDELEEAIEYTRTAYEHNLLDTLFDSLNEENTSHLNWRKVVTLPAYADMFV